MSYLQRTAEGVTIARTVPAGESDRIEWTVPQDATVEAASARIYTGAENTLRLKLKHRPATASEQQLVVPAEGDGDGKDYIDGDDDDWSWNLSVPVEKGDTLVVEHNNTDGTNAHNYRVNIDVDYMGGVERAVAGIGELVGVR